MQKSAAFLMVTVLLLGLFLTAQSRQNPVAQVDGTFADWVATNSARPAQPSHVVLVEINESSLGGAHPWPWSPLEYALFMRTALQFGPDLLAIEPALAWDAEAATGDAVSKQRQTRKILHDYVLKTPKLVLGSDLGFPEDPDVVPPMQQTPLLRNIKGDTGGIPEFTAITRQADDDLRLSTSVGFTNVPDQGEITRKAPLVFRYRGQLVPSLALQAMIVWFKVTPDDVVVEPGSRIVLGKAATVPIDEAGRMSVDFETPLTRFGYDDLLLAVDQQQGKRAQPVPVDSLKGSIALLARTDKDSCKLLFPTRTRSSSGELCARAIATIQNKAFIHRVSYNFDFAVIALMMALSCFFHRFRKRAFLLLSFSLLLGYLLVSMSVYVLVLTWLPIVLPLGLLFLVNFFSLFTARAVATGPVIPEKTST